MCVSSTGLLGAKERFWIENLVRAFYPADVPISHTDLQKAGDTVEGESPNDSILLKFGLRPTSSIVQTNLVVRYEWILQLLVCHTFGYGNRPCGRELLGSYLSPDSL